MGICLLCLPGALGKLGHWPGKRAPAALGGHTRLVGAAGDLDVKSGFEGFMIALELMRWRYVLHGGAVLAEKVFSFYHVLRGPSKG